MARPIRVDLSSGTDEIGVGIGIAIERGAVAFGHEKLDVYRAAIKYVGWAYRLCEGLKGHRNAKALLDRIVAMLTKLGQRGYAIREEQVEYEMQEIDPDPDTDADTVGMGI